MDLSDYCLTMNALSLDYADLMSTFRPPLDLALVGTALLKALADSYEAS
ncbi:hypothetical protein BKA23_1415 [Rudaeicoccus suwonensis]|uniref:Uncharacterized protein n=1 Tax=Rudaeicoccus suwonensis TaxID=657409 RepID=A0A561EAG3_9MICO|nr:hypothetical protein BKA23_1415 [Rudaeicoccus suwonensis]